MKSFRWPTWGGKRSYGICRATHMCVRTECDGHGWEAAMEGRWMLLRWVRRWIRRPESPCRRCGGGHDGRGGRGEGR